MQLFWSILYKCMTYDTSKNPSKFQFVRQQKRKKYQKEVNMYTSEAFLYNRFKVIKNKNK